MRGTSPSGEVLEDETFRFDGGTTDFVEHLASDGAVCDPVHLVGSGTFKETVPVLDDAGHMTTQEVQRTCEVDVALRWGVGYDTTVQSFCNVVATGHGGTHQAGFERALLRTLNEAAKAARVLRVNDDPLTKDDVLEGLTAVVTVRLPEPQYLGQTKDELGTPGVSRIVADVVAKGLRTEFLDSKKAQRRPASCSTRSPRPPRRGRRPRRARTPRGARPRSRARRCRPSSPTAARPT